MTAIPTKSSPALPKATIEVNGRKFSVTFNARTIEAIEEACQRSCFELFDDMVVLGATNGTATVQVTSLRSARRLVAGALGLSLDESDEDNYVDNVVPMDDLLGTFRQLVRPFTEAVVRLMKPVGGDDAKTEKKPPEVGPGENPPSSDASASGPQPS